MENPVNVDESKTISASDAFSSQLQVAVDRLELLLEELLEKQQNSIKHLESLNGQIGAEEAIQRVHLTMLHTHQYYKKLTQIRKDIVEMCGKATKLKARAEKLQKRQQEEARARLQKRREEEEHEKMLIAKPAKDAQLP